MTYEQKLEKFQAGLWASNVIPYVSHSWTERDWVRFVDLNGRWFNSREEMIDLYGPEIFGGDNYV